jgi:6-phosphogluconate dehydrogenase
MTQCSIGVVGLAVMGQNLVLNLERNGYSVAVYNRTDEKTKTFVQTTAASKQITPTFSLKELVDTLERPRKLLLMVKAGAGTDAVLDSLFDLLDEGDIVMEGGNSYFGDTERRVSEAGRRGIRYLGVGVSGGESGALNGPSIMVGGDPGAFEAVADMLRKIAAKGPGGPCCAYFGAGSAGHYVKMVHNGIEYALMQALSEAYDIMHRGLAMSAGETADVFARWNRDELQSYLVEITEQIFRVEDDETRKPLVELILDTAQQKGTGKWSTQSALDLGSAAPTIGAAVFARALSAMKEDRVAADAVLSGPSVDLEPAKKETMLQDLYSATLLTFVTAYAQGMRQLLDVSLDKSYGLNLAEAARVWMDGCIIRSQLLVPMQEVFKKTPDLQLLLLAEPFCSMWSAHHEGLRRVVMTAHGHGIPVPVMSSSLDFLDGYRAARLPANLLQAQRDFFGAHTYQRIDREGVFHTEWESQ